MICEKCGKEYWTKECFKCKGNEHQFNVEDIKNMKFKNSKNNNHIYKAASIFLTIIFLITITTAAFKIVEQERNIEEHIKTIEEIRNENISLKRNNELNKRVLEDYKKTNIELTHLLRSNKNNLSSKYMIQNPNHQNQIYKTEPIQNNNAEQYTSNASSINQYRPQKREKKYQEFSKYIQLISDSKINKMNDNRLNSNAPIYGRYYPIDYPYLNPFENEIKNIKCGLKKNRYGVVDECSMEISSNRDVVYLGTMEANNIKNFNHKTHMLECNYNKEHGIMGDCRVKLKI